MNLYETLDVQPDATEDEIKRAYRKKARKIHPDAGGDKDEFAKLSSAYNILIDPRKREMYDLTGDTDQTKSPTSPAEEKFLKLMRAVYMGDETVFALLSKFVHKRNTIEDAIEDIDERIIPDLNDKHSKTVRKHKKLQDDVGELLVSLLEHEIENAKKGRKRAEQDLEETKEVIRLLKEAMKYAN